MEKITGRINSEAVLADVIGTGPTFFPAMKQLAENSVDAGAGVIEIEIVDRGKSEGYITVTDNGRGFMAEDFNAFCSLRLSSKTGKPGQIGKHGSGRLFLLRFAGKVSVYTKSSAFPKLSTFSFTRQDLVELIERSERHFERQEIRKPQWLPLDTNTGTVVVIEDINWKQVPTIREMIARFAEHLKPSIARAIRVNGQPLAPREVVGEIIQESIKVDYLPGVQEIELFIPVQLRRGEEIMLGGLNHICGLSTVYKQLKPMDASMVPSLMLDRSVCGAIFIPALNEFRASTSDGLEAGFFGVAGAELRHNVLRFMQEEIRPRVEAAVSRKQKRDESSEQAALLEDMVQRVNSTFDFDPNAVRGGGNEPDKPRQPRPPQEPQSGLQVNTRHLTLTPGETFTFYIRMRTGTSGKFAWDDSHSGGKVVPKSGHQVVYTAGKTLSKKDEPFELVVWDAKARNLTVTIYIQIVDEKPVSITPRQVDIFQGASHVFRVRNPTETSGDIFWRIKGQAPGVSLLRDSGSSTEVIADTEASLGSYTLVAEDLEREISYEATFRICEVKRRKGTFIKIENVYYLIEPAPHIQMVVERVKDGSVIVQGGRRKKVDVLRVGFNHPILRALRGHIKKGDRAATEAYMQKALEYIFLAHLRGCEEDGGEMLDGHTTTQRLIQLELALLETSQSE